MNNTSKILSAVVVIIILVGGGFYLKNHKPITVTPVTPVVTEPVTQNQTPNPSIKGCYVAKLGKDVYTLQITSEENGNIVGTIAFNNFEKDSSSGTFNGTFSNDILVGTYSFNSEGMQSKRQLVFKKVGNDFVEGFGDVVTTNDSEVLKDLTAVTYDPKSTFIKNATCTQTFTSKDKAFTFKYNSFFGAVDTSISAPQSLDWELDAKQKGNLLATVSIPRSFMPQTNFSEAKLTVGKSTDKDAFLNCLIKDEKMSVTKPETVKIGQDLFTKLKFSDAGAGNFYETTSYRGAINQTCYVIESTIHSTNIGNYDPSQGIKEFDKSKIEKEFSNIIASFKFL